MISVRTVLLSVVGFWLYPCLVVAEPVADPSGHSLDAFFAALERVERGEPTLARVVQMGDSHTACDLWTGEVRRSFQKRFGDGGHGFVIPGRPWSQYAHMDVVHGQNDSRWKVSRLRPATAEVGPFGLGGVFLVGQRIRARLVVGTRAKAPVGGRVSLFDLFYRQRPDGGSIRVRLDGRQILEMSTRWSEARPGFRQIEVPEGAHRLELEALGPGKVQVHGVVLERRGPGVVVDSVGVPGLRAENLLMHDAATLKAHLVRRNPDLVVLAFGAVEANHPGFDPFTYPAKLAEVLALLREGAPSASCLILAPPDRAKRGEDGSWSSPPVIAEILDAQLRAATELGCAFWDSRAAMGGEGASHRWFQEKLAQRDHIHLNRRGYAKLGGLLADALMEAYESRVESPRSASP